MSAAQEADPVLLDLLLRANRAGVAFRLAGGAVGVTAPPGKGAELAPLLVALKPRRDAIWAHLGGPDMDAPSLALLAKLGVELVVPQTETEALAVLAEIEADSDANTPPEVLRKHGGLIALDVETAALPGAEQRPAVKLRLRDARPLKKQPSSKKVTAALDPHRSTIRLAQLYAGGRRCLVLNTTLVPLPLLAGVLRRRTAIVHNASFELRHLAEAGIDMPRFEDSMQACGLLLGVHRRGLDDGANAYLGIDLPKGLQTSDWSAPRLSPGQLAYAALDPIVTWRLWAKLRIDLLAKGRGRAYVLQRDVTRPVVRMTTRGITLDRAAHQQQINEWRVALADAYREFEEATGQQPPKTPAQTRVFLTKTLPADVIAAWPTTEKSQEMSTKAVDMKRHLDVPAVRLLVEINAKAKLLNSFGDDLAAKISAKTGRLHPGYNIASAKTGRFASAKPNIQQIPKNKARGLRAAFGARPGYTLVIADYKMMELRGIGAIANDTAMNADFANGIDLHRRQAAETLGIELDAVTPQQRDAAKPICFGVIYGAGPRGLAMSARANYGMDLSEADAALQKTAFLTRYPDVATWQDANFNKANWQGYIEIGHLGRVIEAEWESTKGKRNQWRNWRRDDDDELDADEEEDDTPLYDEWALRRNDLTEGLKRTLCCNAPVQGACADAAMRALMYVDTALIEAGIDGGPVLFVHDEIVCEVADADVARAGAIMTDQMVRAFAETFPNAPLNDLVELDDRQTWGKPVPAVQQAPAVARTAPPGAFETLVRDFDQFGQASLEVYEDPIRYLVNEYWTSGQRKAHSIHEISYRACFKAQLPAFFIDRLTEPGEAVYDPFMGRGTTPVQAALMGRRPIGNDINPLSVMLTRPRLAPPAIQEIAQRLDEVPWDRGEIEDHPDLLTFYSPATLRHICALRTWLLEQPVDPINDWIRVVALNKLTGHSSGFFSVYSMPPDHAVSVEAQRRINEKEKQVPPDRDVKNLILKKTRSLLAKGSMTAHPPALLITSPAQATPAIASASVQLVVTSSPFLDVVNYAEDNWLRCWFAGIDVAAIAFAHHRTEAGWQAMVRDVLIELTRVVRPGGHVAFEVGEVRNGKVLLERLVWEAAEGLPFDRLFVMVNQQEFTKTAMCWGVSNNTKGTNTNRIVVLRRRA